MAAQRARTGNMRESDLFRVVQSSDGAQEIKRLEYACMFMFHARVLLKEDRNVPVAAGGMMLSPGNWEEMGGESRQISRGWKDRLA